MLGPGDSYLVQSDADDTKFWAWKDAPALGCTFEREREDAAGAGSERESAALAPAAWRDAVRSGFQVLPGRFQGRLARHDGTRGGVRAGQGTPGTAAYDFAVAPVAGWGATCPSRTRAPTRRTPRGSEARPAGWRPSPCF